MKNLMVNNILLKISIIFWIGFSYCQLPFVIGEQLVYDVDFRIFSAGKTTLKIQPDSINGIEVYKITAITKTNSFLDRFYKVRDRVDAWVDTDKFNLLKVKKKIREKKYKSDFTAIININDSTAISKNKITKLPGNVLDPYTAIYYFRTLVLELGKKYQFYSYDNGKVKEIIIHLTNLEKISVPAGKFECFVISPSSINGKKLLKNNGEMKIWLSNDNRRLPVKIEQKTNIGIMVLNLRDIIS